MRPGLLLRAVEVRPGVPGDVRVAGPVIAEIGPALAGRGEREVRGAGGALLPGLHDHHCHLLATAAAAGSVPCGPPGVTTAAGLAAALRAAVPDSGGWVRGVGYDEAVAGPLDRAALDRLVPDAPARVQHRSGALWMLNTRALEALGVDDAPLDGAADARLDGAERDASGRLTGRFWRLDGWLQRRLAAREPARAAPDLAPVGRMLARYGVTGVTDATPDLPARSLDALAAARRSGALPQRILLLGADPGFFPAGPRKIVLADHDLPAFDRLRAAVAAARRAGRPVALHCVTREALLLALAVLDEAGPRPGDRIEHAAVAPPEAVQAMARAGLAVVTQPSLLARRGDDYLDRAEADDVPFLWRYRSFLDAGVPVGGSSDAPYGDLDPWASIVAATSRTTPSGRVAGPGERVSAGQALAGYLSDPRSPGGPPRELAVGRPADLVLLRDPLAQALAEPGHDRVRLTLIGGIPAYEAG